MDAKVFVGGGVSGLPFPVVGFRLSAGERYLLFWSEQKMKAIATQGRSYGGVL